MESLTLTNRDATIALGKKIGQQLVAGDVLVLDGDLGAGKTTFTKGLAAGLEIPDIIKSPTFTIIHEYQDGRLPLYHMDAYRLENGGAEDLGLEEYFDGDGVSVVEWAEFVEDELPVLGIIWFIQEVEPEVNLLKSLFAAGLEDIIIF